MIKAIVTTLFAFTAVSARANGLFPVAPPASTVEIQVFLDYRGFNDYAYKYVSLPNRLISAGYLYPSDSPVQNGACWNGDVYAARDLFQKMVYDMNWKWRSYVKPIVVVRYDADGTPYLKVSGETNGTPFVWFDRISECLGWSTPEERALEPLN